MDKTVHLTASVMKTTQYHVTQFPGNVIVSLDGWVMVVSEVNDSLQYHF